MKIKPKPFPRACFETADCLYSQEPKHSVHVFHISVPVEAKEAVALENKDLLPEKSVPTVDVAVTEKQKEEAEHNHVQHAEPQQEKTPQEPTGRIQIIIQFYDGKILCELFTFS